MKRHPRSIAAPALRASNDRWLFGYADVVTLLFACFASLYATEAMPAHARRTHDVPLPREAPPQAEPTVPVWDLALERVAAAQEGGPSLEVATEGAGLVLSLAETGSFAPGRAELTPAARRVLATVGDVIARLPNDIRVEGHTDDAPVQGGVFASNWDLSTARATRVVQYLSEAAGIDPRRLSAAGYAEYRPRVPNDTPESRARNRRVDIVVLGGAASAIPESRR